ncbi:MAG: CDP-alcohol phosphatidyltransferase family protein [Mariprofundaceae bacterium]
MNIVLNIPNVLTLIRMILTPVIVYAIFTDKAWIALGLMVFAAITDMLDGAIARYFNQRTKVGAYLDPLADKVMLITLILTLIVTNQVPLFLFLAVVLRDIVIVSGAWFYELATHDLKIEPSLASKTTTGMQMMYVAMVLVHMAYPLPMLWLEIATWLTFIVTCVSGVHYMVAWARKASHQEES